MNTLKYRAMSRLLQNKKRRFCVQGTLPTNNSLKILLDLGIGNKFTIVVTHISLTGIVAVVGRTVYVGGSGLPPTRVISYSPLTTPTPGHHAEVDCIHGLALPVGIPLQIASEGGTGPSVHVVAEGYVMDTY